MWLVVLYGCETWMLRRAKINKLEALEMWIWRRLEKLYWQDRIKNEEVLSMVGQKRNLVKTIQERKKNWMDALSSSFFLFCIKGEMDC